MDSNYSSHISITIINILQLIFTSHQRTYISNILDICHTQSTCKNLDEFEYLDYKLSISIFTIILTLFAISIIILYKPYTEFDYTLIFTIYAISMYTDLSYSLIFNYSLIQSYTGTYLAYYYITMALFQFAFFAYLLTITIVIVSLTSGKYIGFEHFATYMAKHRFE